MKNNENFWERLNLLPLVTEGDGDDVIDLDMLLQSGENLDRTKTDDGEGEGDEGETEEQKTARLAAEEAARLEAEGEGEEDKSTLELIQGFTSDEVSEDDKEIRDELLSHFKGEGFDNDGNVLDADGNIIVNFEDVDKFINTEPTFDDKGNQVDETGKVIKTKSEVEFEKSAIGGVVADLPYELVGEDGQPKTYTDTKEGFVELAQDIAAIELEDYKKDFFSSNDELREISKHILGGGTIETFNKPIDYKSVDIKTLTADQKLNLIKQSFVASGMDSERAADFTELVKSKGDTEVDKELDKSIKVLEGKQQEYQQARDTAYQAQIKQENDNVVRYWGEVKQTLDTGKLGNLNIPKEESVAFFKYISTPVDKEGNSQEFIDREADSMSDDLMARFLRFKKYNVSNIVNKKVQQKQVEGLREKINKARKSKSSSSRMSSNNNNTGGDDVSLDNLLQ